MKIMDSEGLSGVINDLKACLAIKEAEISKLQAKCNKQIEQTVMSKDDKEKFIKNHLPMLTENQIKLMTKHKKRVNWTTDEIAKGFTSLYFSRRAHNYFVNVLQIPLPAIRTFNSWAMKMVIAPGFLTDVLLMLKGYAETLTKAERQVILSFDEMACKAWDNPHHKVCTEMHGFFYAN